jgi:hypothetical protein
MKIIRGMFTLVLDGTEDPNLSVYEHIVKLLKEKNINDPHKTFKEMPDICKNSIIQCRNIMSNELQLSEAQQTMIKLGSMLYDDTTIRFVDYSEPVELLEQQIDNFVSYKESNS